MNIRVKNGGNIYIPDGTYEIIDKILCDDIKGNTLVFINSDIKCDKIKAENVVFIEANVEVNDIKAKNILNDTIQKEEKHEPQTLCEALKALSEAADIDHNRSRYLTE